MDLTQRGLSDNEILHQLADAEAVAGYSPTLVDEDEVRSLATPNVVAEAEEADHFHAMQLGDAFRSLGHEQDALVDSPLARTSSDSTIAEDWFIDLQRIVQNLEGRCTSDNPDDFMISVYTWFLDHETHASCNEPKIAVLGGFVAEWREDLLYPWRHILKPDEHVFLDLVSPFVPRSDLEEHVAHIILTQRPGRLSSVLLSLDFVDPLLPMSRSVIIRYAVAVPRQCSRHDFDHWQFFARFPDSRLRWQFPTLAEPDQTFQTRNGMGIQIQVLPEIVSETLPLADATHLLQVQSESRSLAVIKPSGVEQGVSNMCGKPVSSSFTDEFLAAVAAQEEAQRMDPPTHPLPDPRSIIAQPEFIQSLWDRFLSVQDVSTGNANVGCRIESWFLDHDAVLRCHTPRITLLPDDFLSWRQLLLNTWQDKLDGSDDIHIVVVDPLPEDAAVGILAQLIVTQRAVPVKRSSVLSVYDSDPDAERSPFTFALVVPQQLTLSRLIDLLHLRADCHPPDLRNHCSLWFGRMPISESSVINVHMGHAFRLLVARGVRFEISQLLDMSHSRLREVLQSSMRHDIFIRPPDPSFLHSPDGTDFPALHDVDMSPDTRPEWISVLQRHFNFHHVFEDLEEGPVLYGQVWYLNAHPDFHCDHPRRVSTARGPTFMANGLDFLLER